MSPISNPQMQYLALLPLEYTSGYPLHIQLPLVAYAVLQVEIDQALVRDARLLGHGLEVFNDVGPDTQRDLFLELPGVGIASRLHPREIVFVLHCSPSVVLCLVPGCPSGGDDANDRFLCAVAVAHHKQAEFRADTQHKEPVFPLRILIVVELDRQPVVEDTGRFIE